MSAPRLKLAIRNVDALDNGLPTTLWLDQRGAIIGRAATADWSLPDSRSYVSSRHCEITYRDGRYSLTDISTNGTFVNGAKERVSGPHFIADGDLIQVGHYEIVASVQGEVAPAAPEPPKPGWGGWEAPPAPLPGHARLSGWDARPDTGNDPRASGWDAPGSPAHGWSSPTSEPVTDSSPWDQPKARAQSSSPWSSSTVERSRTSADDIWGQITQGNVVDWARGGFGAPAPPLTTPVAPPMGAAFTPSAPEPRLTVPPLSQTTAAEPPATAISSSPTAIDRFLIEAGLQRSDFRSGEDEMLAQAGGLIRRLVAGLVVMMEARARAKSQMGAQSTIFSREGNNPIKFARTPQEAIVQLLNPPVSGFMRGDRAVEDSFRDLQAHQMATLKAMQGALRSTLDRFSPAAIRKRAESGGFLKRILPGTRDAALWQAYEKEFSGVTNGSEEAFLDTFAKEFRKAYEEAARG